MEAAIVMVRANKKRLRSSNLRFLDCLRVTHSGIHPLLIEIENVICKVWLPSAFGKRRTNNIALMFSSNPGTNRPEKYF